MQSKESNIKLLLLGRAVSLFGNTIYLIVLPLYILNTTQNLKTTGIFFAEVNLPTIIIVFSIKLWKPLYFSSVSGLLISENNTLEAISKNFEIIFKINETISKKIKELEFLKYKNRIKYNIEVRKSHIKIIFFLLNFSINVPISGEIIIVGRLIEAKKIPVVFKF